MLCMHPRNRYADQTPDFAALAQSFPELQQHVKTQQNGKASIDFRRPQACKCLTKALLKHDFGITWTIPDGQLVPPLANRANYIHWLEDLLALSSPERDEPVKGMLCCTHVYVLCVCFMCMLLLGSVLVLVSKRSSQSHMSTIAQGNAETDLQGTKRILPTTRQTKMHGLPNWAPEVHCIVYTAALHHIHSCTA